LAEHRRRRSTLAAGWQQKLRCRPGGGPADEDGALAEDRRTRTAPWQRAQAQEICPGGGMATKVEIPPWRRTGGPGGGRRPGRDPPLAAGWRKEEGEDGLAAMVAQQRRDGAKKVDQG
jgi:hypothetical protein